jgi:hypothetical protein
MTSRICPKCQRPVAPQQWIFQLATGLYVSGFITPTAFSHNAIITEMHIECVEEKCLKNHHTIAMAVETRLWVGLQSSTA